MFPTKGKTKRFGFTEVKNKKDGLWIYHNGNMGNSIDHSVNPNLISMGIPTIQELKNQYEVLFEKGSPDYSWAICFNIKK